MQKLNLMCPMGLTGYGVTSYNIYKELRKRLDLTLFPMRGISVDTEEDQKNCIIDINKQEKYDPNSIFLKIWHQFDLATRIGKGKYGALTFFEIDKLKPIEIHMTNMTDIVFVASEWAKQVLLDNNITTNIAVSPLGVDLDVFNPDSEIMKDVKKPNDNYVFLNIGKWEVRKGHDFLVEAFNNAFTKEDKVELWMLNDNPFLTKEQNMSWINLYKNSPLKDKIIILSRLPKHQDVARLIHMCDCGIFPARAEGWNNEIPEVMAMNKPIIATNYSAHTQYLTKENSYLINIDSLIDAVDDKFFDGYGKWAELGDNQMEQIVEHMRFVYNNHISTNEAGLQTARQLTWANTANIIYHNLFEERL
jgi:hypothetical protein